MFGRFAALWALLTAAIAAAVGAIAYNAGLSAQLATRGGDVAAPAYPYYGYGWGFGFGFGWIIPLLFILLLVSLFRRRRWYGGWYGGHRHGNGPWQGQAPPGVEERLQDWHRKAHGEPPPTEGSPAAS